MPSSSSVRRVMPEATRTGEGLDTGPAVVLSERRGPQRVDPPLSPAHAEVGRWIDAASRAEAKKDSFATLISVDEQYLLKMRKGQKPVSVQHLVAMKANAASSIAFCNAMLEDLDVAELREQVLAFATSLLARVGFVAIPASTPTREEIAEALLESVADGSLIGASLLTTATKGRGWSAEQLARGLGRVRGGEK